MDEVRQPGQGLLEGCAGLGQRRLHAGDGLLERPTLSGVGLSLGGLHLALPRGLVLVAAPVGLVELGLARRHLRVEGDGAVHVGVDAPSPAALQYLVATVCKASGI